MKTIRGKRVHRRTCRWSVNIYWYVIIVGSNYVGYGWNLVAQSAPANYICEMTLEDAKNKRIEDRDFGNIHLYVIKQNILSFNYYKSLFLVLF